MEKAIELVVDEGLKNRPSSTDPTKMLEIIAELIAYDLMRDENEKR